MNHDAQNPQPEPAPEPISTTTLPFEDLERAYEGLAQAIDAAGPDKEALFLTRLALILAHRSGNLQAFEQALATALQDVASKPSPAAAPAREHNDQ